MIFNELKQHGREDFPFELYRLHHEHPKYEMAVHWHTNLEMIRVLSGELTVTLDHRAKTLGQGEIAFINSETVHGATPRNCTYECIVFNLAFLKTGNAQCDEFIESLLSHAAFLTEFPSDSDVIRLTNAVFEQLSKDDAGSPFQTIGLFHQLLGKMQEKKLFNSYLSPSSVQDEKKVVKLKTVLKYIRENFAKPITLEEMAAIAGLSNKYFCKFFKDMTGTTPVNYLLTYRIERAARTLLGTDLSVTQTAYECGFNDVSYFIKTFKTFKNVSPKDYRKR